MKFKIGNLGFSVDWHHVLITIGSAVVGALTAYFEQQTPATLLGALQSWTTAKPMLYGALIAVAGALIALAKSSFIVPPAPPASPDAVQRGGSIPVTLAPPASKRTFGFPLWYVGPIIVMAAGGVVGCTQAQAALATNIENTVLADLAAGKTLPQIEADVASLIICPGAANGSCKSAQAIVAIVNDTLDLLIGLGVIPPGVLPVAQSYHAQLTQQIAASRTP